MIDVAQEAPNTVFLTEDEAGLYLQATTCHIRIVKGQASLSIFRMAWEGLHLELTTALRKNITTKKEVAYQGV